jgi:hypothetical protein
MPVRRKRPRAWLVSKQLEHLHRWDDMTSLYLRALEREPCEEPLRRGLLHALRGQQQSGQPNPIPQYLATSNAE